MDEESMLHRYLLLAITAAVFYGCGLAAGIYYQQARITQQIEQGLERAQKASKPIRTSQPDLSNTI